jgi:hypothetical protein
MAVLNEVKVLELDRYYGLIEKWNNKDETPFQDEVYSTKIALAIKISVREDFILTEKIAVFLNPDKTKLGVSRNDATSLLTHPLRSLETSFTKKKFH